MKLLAASRPLRATLAVCWAAGVCAFAVAAPHPGTPEPGAPVHAVAVTAAPAPAASLAR